MHGTYRRIKWGLLIFALAVYYSCPSCAGTGAADCRTRQCWSTCRTVALLLLLHPALAAGGLFLHRPAGDRRNDAVPLMNALAGRVWCGYLCPQTVWTDLFYAVERWVEGDRRDRIMKDKKGWTPSISASGAEAFHLADDRLVDRRPGFSTSPTRRRL